ncbi:hypothetical protein J007_02090 [Cryptococcus neoformans]|nr:hypothetical protein C356_02112 [Cryptococcus neoformans var. grubii c45]OXB38126.1 hypothetical protein J007_02090 [Cryptococcus neoformans var. grubii]OXC62439.1 hypothetical protein C358_02156 [Cryptococcus neoformans var. grubii MW-RSA852]
MFIQAILGASVTVMAGLYALKSGANPAHSDNVPYEVDLHWMRKSIEVMPPCHFNAYGSVIVNASNNELLCSGYNSQLAIGDPTEHGEVNAIRNCVKKYTELGWTPAQITEIWPQSWIYTTAEPCPMCGSTILQSGFKRVVYGTSSPDLVGMGWTEYLVSVRVKWLRKAAVVQPGFGGGRPVTQVVGHVGNNETDPRLAWQFNLDYPCPEGCHRHGEEQVCKPVA